MNLYLRICVKIIFTLFKFITFTVIKIFFQTIGITVTKKTMMLKTIAFLLFLKAAVSDDHLLVETTCGAVSGFTLSSRSGRQYLAFKGIPFAKPPIGPLRFKPPEEPLPWSGLRNATEDGPYCIQYVTLLPEPKVRGKEDCLLLNVFTPNTGGRLSVLFHIHGGGWARGDKTITGPEFLMDHDIVIVDVNYRLGPLGFLSFEDEVMPGNQGLKDQLMALRWVKKNIANFGGDPNRITLVGESAGAASVNHHLVSPLSRGLFSGAIVQSGGSYSAWALSPPGLAKSRAKKLARLLSCPEEDTEEEVACLTRKDPADIIKELGHYIEWQVDPYLVFQPTLEPAGPEAFLPGPIRKWHHDPVPLLIGINSAEGYIRTKYFLKFKMDFKWYSDNFENLAPLSVDYLHSASNPHELTNKIKKFYFGDADITELDWKTVTDLYSDSWVAAGVIESADKHTGDVFFYYFDYLGGPTLGPSNRTLAFGAVHGDEMFYFWNCQYLTYNLTKKQEEFSKNMVKIMADFVKNGKAISPTNQFVWEKWSRERHNYMYISNSGFFPKEKLLDERYKFWKSLKYRDNYEKHL